MSSKLCILVLAAISALPVFADTVDDAIVLTQKGASEEVVVAWSYRHATNLSASDIIRLKDAGVSNRVIAALNSGSSETYVSTPSTTTYVETPTYYYDSTPYYYSSPYYSRGYGYYNRGYYGGYYGGYRPGISLNFGFGGGSNHRGYHSYGHRR